MKNRKAERRIEKLKQEELSLTFKPTIPKPSKHCEVTLNVNKYGGNDFLNRVEYHKEKKEKRLESIKSRVIDPDEEEYTFKPNISSKSKQTKRKLSDLYVIIIIK
jgi:hypothetical protein